MIECLYHTIEWFDHTKIVFQSLLTSNNYSLHSEIKFTDFCSGSARHLFYQPLAGLSVGCVEDLQAVFGKSSWWERKENQSLFVTKVESQGYASGTTWFRRVASRTAELSGTTSRL